MSWEDSHIAFPDDGLCLFDFHNPVIHSCVVPTPAAPTEEITKSMTIRLFLKCLLWLSENEFGLQWYLPVKAISYKSWNSVV